MVRKMPEEYYKKRLASNKLKRCYDIASSRINQYLLAEIDFIASYIQPKYTILELGCGYGRVMKPLLAKTKEVYGIDTSKESLELAKEFLKGFANFHLLEMDASEMTFKDNKFDIVFGIQNSISAFKVNPEKLIKESLRVTKKGGKVFFSSYSEKIWDARIEWFIAQSKEGLLGEIDQNKTRDGIIICKDGFSATTYTKNDFQNLINKLELKATIIEVDNSSIFCIIEK